MLPNAPQFSILTNLYAALRETTLRQQAGCSNLEGLLDHSWDLLRISVKGTV